MHESCVSLSPRLHKKKIYVLIAPICKQLHKEESVLEAREA